MMRLSAIVIAAFMAGLAPIAQLVAQPEQEPTLLYATQLMQQAETQARAIQELSFVNGAEAFDVSKLPREDASEALFEDTMDQFSTRYRDGIASLRSAIADNPVVAEAVTGAGVEPTEVVAAEIREDLSLRLYTYKD